ncbi:MAG: 50S ribosomal protein L25 [Patescibacteria group bacterium]
MTLQLEAKKRTILGKKNFALREQGGIPAVLYGHGFENQSLSLDYSAFEKAFKEAGENTIIDLAIDGQAPVKVLIADVTRQIMKDRIEHVDLKQIKMDEKITAQVKLEFIGEAKPVKEDGAVFVHNVSEVEILCLPGDLIHEIDVDISKLEKVHDVILFRDLPVASGVEIMGHDLDDVVATVVPPKVEKKEEPAVTAEAPAEGAKTETEAEKSEEKK